LIAELGAAFLCAHLGLSNAPRDDHAQYVHAWLKALKADSRAIFTAASQAQKACNFLTEKAMAEIA
jgi:antirestriction protein ArdC